MTGIDHLLVVVPAHDEEELLDDCLTLTGRAAAVLGAGGPQVHRVVVLDDCRDGSEAVARRHDVEVVTCAVENVGVARAVGVAVARRHVADPARAWIATTDADSRVPASWFLDHLAASEQHDLLVGPVVPDPSSLHPAVLREWRRRHTRVGHHVHGANLGIRLAAYDVAGGFAPVPTGEDVTLVDAARRSGARVTGVGRPVMTATRQQGRAPAGFAAYLAALALEVLPGP